MRSKREVHRQRGLFDSACHGFMCYTRLDETICQAIFGKTCDSRFLPTDLSALSRPLQTNTFLPLPYRRTAFGAVFVQIGESDVRVRHW